MYIVTKELPFLKEREEVALIRRKQRYNF